MKRSSQDWVLESVALAALLSAITLVVQHWSRIPVPHISRFHPPGMPTPWNPRTALLILLGINVGVYSLFTAAGRYQGLINIPAEINRESPHVRQLLLSMMIVLKATAMVFSAYLTWAMVNAGLHRGRSFSPATLLVFAMAVAIPLVLYTGKLLEYRK